jgi:hypothetical protein
LKRGGERLDRRNEIAIGEWSLAIVDRDRVGTTRSSRVQVVDWTQALAPSKQAG